MDVLDALGSTCFNQNDSSKSDSFSSSDKSFGSAGSLARGFRPTDPLVSYKKKNGS